MPTPSSIAELIRARGISRVVHFTPFPNLLGIFRVGRLLPRDALLAHARENNDERLLDYVAFNDTLRLDARPDCINLSIQHPNIALLRRFRQRFVHCDLWAILLLSPTCLETPGTLFTTGNAASTQVRRFGTREGPEGLAALFAESRHAVNLHGVRVLGRRDLPPSCPTDPQAEVLLPRAVSVEELLGIAVATPEHAARARAALELVAGSSALPPFDVEPALFQSPHTGVTSPPPDLSPQR